MNDLFLTKGEWLAGVGAFAGMVGSFLLGQRSALAARVAAAGAVFRAVVVEAEVNLPGRPGRRLVLSGGALGTWGDPAEEAFQTLRIAVSIYEPYLSGRKRQALEKAWSAVRLQSDVYFHKMNTNTMTVKEEANMRARFPSLLMCLRDAAPV